jgi:hypothetical protein
MFPYGAIAGLALAMSRSQQVELLDYRGVDRAVGRMRLSEASRKADLEQGKAKTDVARSLLLYRKAFIRALEGDPDSAVGIVKPIRWHAFPRQEQIAFFNVEMLSWLLMGRGDAARDIVEVMPKMLSPDLFDIQNRSRVRIAVAAYHAWERRFAAARPILERAARSRKALECVLGLTFLAALEREEGHAERARELEARLSPHVTPRFLETLPRVGTQRR